MLFGDIDFFVILAYIRYSKQCFELHAVMKDPLKKRGVGMKYNKKGIDPERLIGLGFLVLENKKMKVGRNGLCDSSEPEGIKINKNITIPKGEVLTIRRLESSLYIVNIEGMRTFIPADEFLKIKILQPGDLVCLEKGQIGMVIIINDADNIRIRVCEGTIESPGKYTGEISRAGIDNIMSVASPKKEPETDRS